MPILKAYANGLGEVVKDAFFGSALIVEFHYFLIRGAIVVCDDATVGVFSLP